MTHKMVNQKSQAEKRLGTVFGSEQYTDARVPDWTNQEQIASVNTGTSQEPTGGSPTDARNGQDNVSGD